MVSDDRRVSNILRFSVRFLCDFKVKGECGILLWYGGIFTVPNWTMPKLENPKQLQQKVLQSNCQFINRNEIPSNLASSRLLSADENFNKTKQNRKPNSGIKNYVNQLSYVTALQRCIVIWPHETLPLQTNCF